MTELNVYDPLILIFMLGPLILCIAALINILKSDFKDGATKIIWVLIVLLMPIIGPLLYFFVGKTKTSA